MCISLYSADDPLPGNAINTYKELIGCFLSDDEGNRLAYTHFNCYVRRRSCIDLLFHYPAVINPDVKYRLSVSLFRPGCYPMPGKNNFPLPVAVGDGTQFTFSADDPSETRDTFFRGVIYRF